MRKISSTWFTRRIQKRDFKLNQLSYNEVSFSLETEMSGECAFEMKDIDIVIYVDWSAKVESEVAHEERGMQDVVVVDENYSIDFLEVREIESEQAVEMLPQVDKELEEAISYYLQEKYS